MSNWIDIKDELPDEGEYVLTKCPKMGRNGETMIIVAKLFDDEWYSFFPWDQPVEPTHWCYTCKFNFADELLKTSNDNNKKDLLKILNIRFSNSTIELIQKSANKCSEGNFNQEVRELVKIGLKHRK